MLPKIWLKWDQPVQLSIHIFDNILLTDLLSHLYTGGPCLSQIFWEHENLSGLNVIQLIQLL